jgi:AcrR family transcriptional regulator
MPAEGVPVAADSRDRITERKREAVRAHLTEVALELVRDRDFDSVSVEEIAAAAGISRRTFFRYFSSKEDVILGFLERMGDRLRERVLEAPPELPPLAAVHAALRPQVAAYAANADRALALVRLLQLSPSLRARELESRQRLREKVADAIAARLGVEKRADARPRLLAGIALVPFDVAITLWLEGRSQDDVHAILDETIAGLSEELAVIHAQGG